MKVLRVEVPRPAAAPSYDVVIGRGALARLGEFAAARAPAHRYAVIADSRVAELYGEAALASLAGEGLDALLLPFPAGEWNKTRETWADVLDGLLEAGLGRDAAVIGLGGGVTGDLAGFVAATFLRGVPVVQVPTTLLAMVDSSVGGKTGVDAPAAKNATGAFHHPAGVLVDPDVLVTLPPFQLRAGLAEPVKMAAMRDAEFFAWIAERADGLAAAAGADGVAAGADGVAAGATDELEALVGRSVAAKAAVVAADPLERDLRAVLNFGHTVGHALEALSGYSLVHGEAVAFGMRVEARLGELVGCTAAGTADAIGRVLDACGLPAEPDPDWTVERILAAARADKKSRRGAIRWALPARIGEAARDGAGAHTVELPTDELPALLGAALRTCAEVPDSPA
ncbi:MAG: 3-dehydroquinate synthase [Gemmatimonadota bacterium]|nr:3-dehydroquinate synthase [Gemmatimonadota bacterium]